MQLGVLFPIPYLWIAILCGKAPPGTKAAASEKSRNVWITTQLFLGYFDHFKGHVPCSPKQPDVLLMENQDSHMS